MNAPEHAAPLTQLGAALTEAHRIRPVAGSGAPGHAAPRGSELWQEGGTPIPVTDIGPPRRSPAPSPAAAVPGISGRLRSARSGSWSPGQG